MRKLPARTCLVNASWNGARFSWSQHQSTLALQKFNQFFPLWTWSQFLVLGHLMSRVSWALSVTGSEVTQMVTGSLSGRSGCIRGKSEQRVVMADWLKRGRGVWGSVKWNRNEDGERAHRHTQEREVIPHGGARTWKQGKWRHVPGAGLWVQRIRVTRAAPSGWSQRTSLSKPSFFVSEMGTEHWAHSNPDPT